MKEAFVGFDPAWGGNRPGAIACAIFQGDKLERTTLPRLASFDDAARIIEELQEECDDVLIAIDQPIIVPNRYGVRPVDPVAHALMDAIFSIGLFVNRGDKGQRRHFGDRAPVWRFIGQIGPTGYSGMSDNDDRRAFVDFEVAKRPGKGATHLIEVYPALALPALNRVFMDRRSAARYNPDNRRRPYPFSLDDWRLVCETVGSYAKQFHIPTLYEWAGKMRKLAEPEKEHQDRLDASICLIIALQWRNGRQIDGMCVIGDLNTGYIVTPTSKDTRVILQNAVDMRVPLNCR